MFKTEIEYTDYNGNQRKDTLYFNLSKAEMMEMELSTTAGVEEKLRMLIATKDNATIVKTFKDLVLKSYGIKSEDGTRFIKNDRLREEFEQSEAYSEMFMKLISDNEFQAKFINGIISGVNMPEMKEEDAIAKLKEMGYDTTSYEKYLESENKVVPMNKENAENNSNT